MYYSIHPENLPAFFAEYLIIVLKTLPVIRNGWRLEVYLLGSPLTKVQY